jgi:hypothetical protein
MPGDGASEGCWRTYKIGIPSSHPSSSTFIPPQRANSLTHWLPFVDNLVYVLCVTETFLSSSLGSGCLLLDRIETPRDLCGPEYGLGSMGAIRFPRAARPCRPSYAASNTHDCYRTPLCESIAFLHAHKVLHAEIIDDPISHFLQPSHVLQSNKSATLHTMFTAKPLIVLYPSLPCQIWFLLTKTILTSQKMVLGTRSLRSYQEIVWNMGRNTF